MNPTISVSPDTGGLLELGKATALPALGAAAGAGVGLAIGEGDSFLAVALCAAIGAFVGSAVANAPPKQNP